MTLVQFLGCSLFTVHVPGQKPAMCACADGRLVTCVAARELFEGRRTGQTPALSQESVAVGLFPQVDPADECEAARTGKTSLFFATESV